MCVCEKVGESSLRLFVGVLSIGRAIRVVAADDDIGTGGGTVVVSVQMLSRLEFRGA